MGHCGVSWAAGICVLRLASLYSTVFKASKSLGFEYFIFHVSKSELTAWNRTNFLLDSLSPFLFQRIWDQLWRGFLFSYGNSYFLAFAATMSPLLQSWWGVVFATVGEHAKNLVFSLSPREDRSSQRGHKADRGAHSFVDRQSRNLNSISVSYLPSPCLAPKHLWPVNSLLLTLGWSSYRRSPSCSVLT